MGCCRCCAVCSGSKWASGSSWPMLVLWKDLSTQSVGIALCNAATQHHWHIVRHLLQLPGLNSVDLSYVLGKADETGDPALMDDLQKILA